MDGSEPARLWNDVTTGEPPAAAGTSVPGGAVAPDELEGIVARARGGDRDAFAAFHARFARFVHAVLLAHAPPREVDDLHQEVFVAAWRHLPGLREAGRAGAWLATIARHAAKRRRGERSGAQDPQPLPAELADPRGGAGGGGEELDGTRLLALLRELPAAYRETLALRLIEGFNGPEIAAATGLTHGSVRVNLHRGLQLLREKLREEGYA